MRTKAGVLLGWAVAAWSLLPASCALDWTVPDGAGGSMPDEIVCSSAETCTCGMNQLCSMACTGDTCEIVCSQGSNCDVGCSGADCHLTCESGATCDVGCSAATCDLTCPAGSICSLSCVEAAGCTITCDANALCQCNGGDCGCVGAGCK